MDAPEVSQPDLDQAEGEEDISQARKRVKQMEKMFEDLLNTASDDLEERNVPIPVRLATSEFIIPQDSYLLSNHPIFM